VFQTHLWTPIDKPGVNLCALAHLPARAALILQTSKNELRKTDMTTAKLIAANFAAWSLAVGIWALNLGMFQAVA